MAKRTVVELIDDLDGGKADETVRFGLDGTQYEIDLSAKHAGELRDYLAKWTGQARRVSRSAAQPKSSAKTSDSTAIREWASVNGHKVSARGRISADVRKAYEATH